MIVALMTWTLQDHFVSILLPNSTVSFLIYNYPFVWSEFCHVMTIMILPLSHVLETEERLMADVIASRNGSHIHAHIILYFTSEEAVKTDT